MTDWRDQLSEHFRKGAAPGRTEDTSEIARFVSGVVVPAFEELAPELEKHGRSVTIRNSVTSAAIIVQNEGEEEMTYRVQGRMFPTGVLPFAEVRFRERKGLRFITVECMFRSGTTPYALPDITREEIIGNFLDNYTRRVMKG
jgi:hypothetical protein